MKSKKSEQFSIAGRTKFRLSQALQATPSFVKVLCYMSGPFIIMFFLGYPIWGFFGDFSHLVFWILAFYIFVGVNVAIKSIQRERILEQPFGLNIFVAITIGAFIWPWLLKNDKQS